MRDVKREIIRNINRDYKEHKSLLKSYIKSMQIE